MDLRVPIVRWKVRAHAFPIQERVLVMGVLNVTPD